MSIKVQLGRNIYPIGGNKRFATVYWRYGFREGAANYDTAEAAASSMTYGEEYGELSPVGIYDTKENRWLAQRVDESDQGYCDGSDWNRAVAMEVPVRVVESRMAE